MKIDFIINNLGSGGAERVLSIIANNLSIRNHHVRIITLDNLNDDVFKLNKNITRIRLGKKYLKNHTLNNLLKLFNNYINKSNRPDLIISFMVETNLLSVFVSKILKINIIVSEHTNHLSGNNKIIRRITRKYVYRLANKVTVLTSFDKDFYIKNKSKAIIVPNPCSFTKRKNVNNKREKVILAVGNTNKYYTKGYDNLIPIIAEILYKHSDWKLKIVGEVEDKSLKYLKKIAKEHKIQDNIIFTGFSNNVSEIMYNSEIYALTSRFEGLPMVLIEAMSQGMACVSYNCITGPSDIIDNNINGILVKNQDNIQMKEKIQYLIENKSFRQKIKTNAIKSIDNYDVEKVVKIWEDIILTN